MKTRDEFIKEVEVGVQRAKEAGRDEVALMIRGVVFEVDTRTALAMAYGMRMEWLPCPPEF